MSEATEQAKLIRWANENRTKIVGLDHLFHVPNGGLRNRVVAGQMIALGVKAGIPDLVLPFASGGYVGLVAEMKSTNGVVSKSQAVWFERFKVQNWKTCVWRSAEEAIAGLKIYLNS